MNNTLFPEIDDLNDNEINQSPEINDISDETPIQESDNQPYEFVTGDLSSFMHDFEEGKEQMGIEQMPTPEEFVEAGKQTIPPQTARKTGKFLANMTDYACATGLSLISGLSIENHKADEESKKELESIITEYIKETGGVIPLWLQLAICLIVTYGLQIPGAIRIRQQNQE